MEEKKIVVSQIVKSLEGDVENTLDTISYIEKNQNYETFNLAVKNRITAFSVEEDTFKTKVDNTDGLYEFRKDGENWGLDVDGNLVFDDVDLSEYGISFEGEDKDRDTIVVILENSNIIFSSYEQACNIFENKTINFISFKAIGDVDIFVFLTKEYEEDFDVLLQDDISFFQIAKFEASNMSLWIFNSKKTDYTVKAIIAKKVEE